ncbi:hypothetical protein O9992_16860 [Vibrio lentus]|nr:hypothetical protein [Vibrio lentus]
MIDSILPVASAVREARVADFIGNDSETSTLSFSPAPYRFPNRNDIELNKIV